MNVIRKRFCRYQQLSTEERRVLASVASVVALTRVTLWISLNLARKSANWGTKLWPSLGHQNRARLVWAVTAASRSIPRATCLTQAVVLQALFSKIGQSSRVEIGVAKQDGFEAHAWVMMGDEVVLGGQENARYTKILAF